MSNIELNQKIETLKAYAKSADITYETISEKSGIPVSTLKKIFSGKTSNPRLDTVQAIERALGINEKRPSNVYDVDGLLVYEEIGTVCAGFNGAINEIPTGKKIEIPASMISGGNKDDYFVLRVTGNSMYPKLLEGDTILCKRCDSVDSGDLAVVLYNGDEATVKKVNYITGQNWLELIPINPEYTTKRIEGVDLEQCRILGKVIKLIRDL